MKLMIYLIVMLSFFFTDNSQAQWYKAARIQSGFSTIYTISFSNEMTGYAGGFLNGIFRTTDGGTNWVNVYDAQNCNVASITCFNNVVYAGIQNSEERISYNLKSTNSGSKWEKQQSFPIQVVSKISFVNEMTGYFLTNKIDMSFKSILNKTVNGGEEWTEAGILSGIFVSVFFPSENTGFEVGENSVYKTSDGGQSWVTGSIAEGPELTTESVFFVDESTGFITCNNNKFDVHGVILKSTDGGATWERINLEQNYWMRTVYFINAETGFAAGNDKNFNGVILKTTNGGYNWNEQNIPWTQILYTIYFVNELTGFAGDISGTILKTTSGGD